MTKTHVAQEVPVLHETKTDPMTTTKPIFTSKVVDLTTTKPLYALLLIKADLTPTKLISQN